MLVAALAFSARQPAPPSIAEVTPQAQHQIAHAPLQKSSGLGAARGRAGGAGAGRAAGTTTTAAQAVLPGSPSGPVEVASAHHCYGNPPMQISFDSQSPPCVAYWELLELAAGIQMAGPDLTPFTFEKGLQAAHFPNPLTPAMEGAAGFGGGSHAMTDDAAMMWWSNTAPSPYPDDGAGTWCYVDGGARHNLSDWPSGPPQFFEGPCDP